MSDASDFVLPEFLMHGARSVITLARRPDFFERQVLTLERAVIEQPSLAIDLAKALVETTCKTILTDQKCVVDRNWDLPKLVKETVSCLKLAPDNIQNEPEVEAGLRKATGSLQGMVQGLCEVRNHEGFASHGRDGYVNTLDIIHAEFIARSADAIVSFLYKTHFKDIRQHRRLVYEDNSDCNEWLDERAGMLFIIYEDASGEQVILDYLASEVLFNVDQDAYKEVLSVYASASASIEPDEQNDSLTESSKPIEI